MIELTPEQQRLLLEPNLAHLATLNRDGSIQSTPLWVDFVDGYVLVNTAEGRQKPKNVRRDPRVTLSVVDRNNGQRYLEIRGHVVELVHEGAYEHLGMLARKYAGPRANNPAPQTQQRVIFKIEPLHTTSSGF
ncbi:MAG TPA: PPOX class F420-dependent oxidoreductase [Dehalococcoidia bacterium]|nr:PPOX class F420-dependent oxidoreductase [Dehalococcoidia bacterium]